MTRGAIRLDQASFATGSLHLVSYARPGKLFTAHASLLVDQVGHLEAATFQQIVEAVIALLRASLTP